MHRLMHVTLRSNLNPWQLQLTSGLVALPAKRERVADVLLSTDRLGAETGSDSD